MKRRTFLKTATASTAGALLAGVPQAWAGGMYADDSPETKAIKIGMIALTDCAPIVMAHELGYFKKFGIESTVSKEASWAVDFLDHHAHQLRPSNLDALLHGG